MRSLGFNGLCVYTVSPEPRQHLVRCNLPMCAQASWSSSHYHCGSTLYDGIQKLTGMATSFFPFFRLKQASGNFQCQSMLVPFQLAPK